MRLPRLLFLSYNMSKAKRSRSADFTEEEVQIMVKYYEDNIEILTAKIGKGITYKDKERAYETLQNKMFAMSGTRRTVTQIKNKWSNLKSK